MKSVIRFISYLSISTVLILIAGCISSKPPMLLPEKREEPKIDVQRPLGVTVDGMDRRLMANTGKNEVLVLNSDYQLIGRITGRTGGGLLNGPHDVAADSKNRIIIADTGNNCIKVYDKNGNHKFTIGAEGSGRKQFAGPQGVATDAGDNIFVCDTGNKRVQVFNKTGKYIFEFNSGEYSYDVLKKSPENPVVETVAGEITLDHPVGVTTMPDNRVVVADYFAGKYSVWKYDLKGKTATPIRIVEPANNFEDYLAGDVAYNPAQNELFYLRSGFPLTNVNFLRVAGIDMDEFEKIPEEYRYLKDDPYEWPHFYRTNGALKTRFFEPRGVAVDSKGNAVVALAVQNRILEISRYEIDERVDRLHPLKMRIINTTQGSFTIEYDTEDKVETKFEFGQFTRDIIFGEPEAVEADFTETYIDKKPKNHHRVEINDLDPSTRYVYRFLTSHRSFPRDSFTNPFVVSTKAPRGQTTYLDLPIHILLLSNIVEHPEVEKLPKDEEGNAILPEDPGSMTEEQIHNVKKDLEAARLYYWVNSNLKMNMKFNYIIDDTRYDGIPFSKWAYYPNADRAKLDELLAENGDESKGYDGSVCVVYGIRKYNYNKGEWFMPGSGGNTWASPHDGSGICVWNAGGGNAWLFGHEYGHQLDIMGNNCGHLYHFNHFHWNYLPGDYGGHWDGSAFIAREFKPNSYLANFYGRLKVSADADDDGVPDDDPNVPLDEKRFLTKPYRPDSDNDGLDDFNEIMSAMWLFDLKTIGGRMVRPVYRPLGNNSDSDNDGIPDGRDPYPLYAFSPDIEKKTVNVDGISDEGEWTGKGVRVIEDEEATGSCSLNWDEKYLYFNLTIESREGTKRPPEINIEIDGNNDGFTVGSDNITIKMKWDANAEGLVITTNHNDTTVRRKPVWKDNINPSPEDVLVEWQKVGDKYIVEIGIPQTPEAGLNLFSGEEIGFNLSFKPEGASDWLMLFEPQELVDITLK